MSFPGVVFLLVWVGISYGLGYAWGNRQLRWTEPSAEVRSEVSSYVGDSFWTEESAALSRQELLRALENDPDAGMKRLDELVRGFLAQGRESDARHVLQWGKYVRERDRAYSFLANHALEAMSRSGAGVDAGILTAITLVETLGDLSYPDGEQERLVQSLIDRAERDEDRRLIQQRLGRFLVTSRR